MMQQEHYDPEEGACAYGERIPSVLLWYLRPRGNVIWWVMVREMPWPFGSHPWLLDLLVAGGLAMTGPLAVWKKPEFIWSFAVIMVGIALILARVILSFRRIVRRHAFAGSLLSTPLHSDDYADALLRYSCLVLLVYAAPCVLACLLTVWDPPNGLRPAMALLMVVFGLTVLIMTAWVYAWSWVLGGREMVLGFAASSGWIAAVGGFALLGDSALLMSLPVVIALPMLCIVASMQFSACARTFTSKMRDS